MKRWNVRSSLGLCAATCGLLSACVAHDRDHDRSGGRDRVAAVADELRTDPRTGPLEVIARGLLDNDE